MEPNNYSDRLNRIATADNHAHHFFKVQNRLGPRPHLTSGAIYQFMKLLKHYIELTAQSKKNFNTHIMFIYTFEDQDAFVCHFSYTKQGGSEWETFKSDLMNWAWVPKDLNERDNEYAKQLIWEELNRVTKQLLLEWNRLYDVPVKSYYEQDDEDGDDWHMIKLMWTIPYSSKKNKKYKSIK